MTQYTASSSRNALLSQLDVVSSLFSASRSEQISREEIFMLLRNCLSLKVPNEDGEDSVKVQKQNNIKGM